MLSQGISALTFKAVLTLLFPATASANPPPIRPTTTTSTITPLSAPPLQPSTITVTPPHTSTVTINPPTLSTRTTTITPPHLSTVTVQPTPTSTSTTSLPSNTPSTGRFCPWCNPSTVPPAEHPSECKLVAQVPETLNTVVAYPVLVFNHDLTMLVHTEMVTPYVTDYLWMGAEVGVNVTLRVAGVERNGEARVVLFSFCCSSSPPLPFL